MKRTLILSLSAVTLFLSSCQTVAEKVSGNYKGVWSVSGPGFTTTAGVFGDGGQLTLTPDGAKRVDMTFASPGNPTVNMQDIDITDIFGTYILNINNDLAGSISFSGAIASNLLEVDYNNSTDTVSVQLSAFTK